MGENDIIGRKIGRYEILEEIGKGGMATVYRALDTNLKREVAVKLLHPHLASHGESRARFQREAQAVARLKHEALLEIYDYSGEEGDDVFIVMELIKGTTLRRLLDSRKDAPFPAEAAALVLRQVSAALAHAHAHGIIHRDVKPENILIGPGGDIKLSDFGIAHLAGMSQMTVTGQILGSPAYMSPEHVEMAELNERADIFSFGIVLYEAAVGHQPFTGPNPHAVLKSIMEGKYDDPLTANPGVGHHVAAIIRKCLKSDPNERYESLNAVGKDLDHIFSVMGFDDPREELRQFLSNPDKWADVQKPGIIEKTLEIGLSAKKQKQHAEAMNHFNRVLTLSPGNEHALQAVAGMNRSRTLKRVLERTAIGLTVAIIIAASVWTAMRRSDTQPEEKKKAADNIEKAPPPPSTPPIEAVLPPSENREQPLSVILPPDDTEQPAKTEHSKGAKSGSRNHSKRTPRGKSPDTPAHQTTREVVFTPQPLSVTVVIDDREQFPFGPANRSKKLTVGPHKIAFVPNDKARFREQSWQVNIPEGEGPYRFSGRLLWQQARLQVKSNVNAQVTVPGRVTDQSGRPFTVEIKKGPSEKLSVLVSREGYIPQTKQVTLTAGELSTLTVDLKKATE